MKALMLVDLPDNINVDLMCKTRVSLTFHYPTSIQILYADGYLKSMPREMAVENRWYSEDFAKGYNQCLYEINEKEEPSMIMGIYGEEE